MGYTLDTLPEDLSILILSFLQVPEILILRITSRRLRDISRLHIVWINASKNSVFPCPDGQDLEQHTRRSYRVASKWRSGRLDLTTQVEFMATLSTSITEVRFLREHWILTVANAIWSVLTIWDWKAGIKCSEWSPQGYVFNGPLTLNSNPDAVACAAILTSQLNGPQHIVLLGLDDAGRLTSILEIPTTLRPIALHGTRLALCDDARTTTIYDYESGKSVCLDSPLVHVVDHCIDVVFAPLHLLIVRARSIALFDYPSGDLIATHSFGWVDGASVTYNQRTNVISLLIRHQSDNPWTADVSTLQLHNIFPTKDGTGFAFPPVAAAGISSPRGALRCPDVVLGRYGTAVWISPQERTMVVDEASDLLSKETLVAAAFPGPLNVDSSRVTAVKMYTNSLNNWTALDYDEEHGRVALGSSFGKVTVLEL